MNCFIELLKTRINHFKSSNNIFINFGKVNYGFLTNRNEERVIGF